MTSESAYSTSSAAKGPASKDQSTASSKSFLNFHNRDLAIFKSLLPFIWEYRGRVLIALSCLFSAKLANVGVPFVLKDIVDALDMTKLQESGVSGSIPPVLVLPMLLLIAYGSLKLCSGLFNELRNYVFAKVRFRVMRRISVKVLDHLHSLSLRYHLQRNTGAISRDLDRGTRSVSTLLNYLTFNIIPTLLEFSLVSLILLISYPPLYTFIIFATVCVYLAFTIGLMEWRLQHRSLMNRHESHANTQAIDSLINYETVKYFNKEDFERRRYDQELSYWEQDSLKNNESISLLNFGQGAIIAIGMTFLMFLASHGVVNGTMTLGDLIFVNTVMLQLFIPLGFIGMIYRQIKMTLIDMELMFSLLREQPEVVDSPHAKTLVPGMASVRFEQVNFGYDPERQILFNMDFQVKAKSKIGIVGASGAGKSTLTRLLFRFYDPQQGRILINGQDISQVSQRSLRQAIGIVPQDTVLFNDSIFYNIAYGASDTKALEHIDKEVVIKVAKLAHIHDFIQSLPDGYNTLVGERGLKLSGGEKQRIAIARLLLKNPPLVIFDEATSSLDSNSEQAIQQSLNSIAHLQTTLIIAHRLSTIIDADHILVLEQGRIIEQGKHQQLLDLGGYYAKMWALQQKHQRQPFQA